MKFQHIFEALENPARALLMADMGIGDRCPVCAAEFSARVRQAYQAGHRVICTPCGWRGNWRFGTDLERSRITAAQILIMDILIHHGVTARRIAEFVRCDPDTVKARRARLEADRG